MIDWHEVRNKIEQGWCRGSYHDEWFDLHYYCILGAIAYTEAPDRPMAWLQEQDSEYVPEEFGRAFDKIAPVRAGMGFGDRLIAWNDNKYRTKQQVLDLVDEVIANANRT